MDGPSVGSSETPTAAGGMPTPILGATGSRSAPVRLFAAPRRPPPAFFPAFATGAPLAVAIALRLPLPPIVGTAPAARPPVAGLAPGRGPAVPRQDPRRAEAEDEEDGRSQGLRPPFGQFFRRLGRGRLRRRLAGEIGNLERGEGFCGDLHWPLEVDLAETESRDVVLVRQSQVGKGTPGDLADGPDVADDEVRLALRLEDETDVVRSGLASV